MLFGGVVGVTEELLLKTGVTGADDMFAVLPVAKTSFVTVTTARMVLFGWRGTPAVGGWRAVASTSPSIIYTSMGSRGDWASSGCSIFGKTASREAAVSATYGRRRRARVVVAVPGEENQ